MVDDDSVLGILTQSDLLKALSMGDRSASVASAMQDGFVSVNSLDMLETAFGKLQGCNCQTLPVTEDGKLVGLLTMDNLGEYMRFQAALKN